MTRSMEIAQADLGLDSLAVVYPGSRRARLPQGITLLPVSSLDNYLGEAGLRG